MLCQRRWKTHTKKIIICKKQVLHVLKCQDAEEKLIAFCHKHSLINMITFAYFILLLICCLNDSCDSLTLATKGNLSSPLVHEESSCVWKGIFLCASPLTEPHSELAVCYRVHAGWLQIKSKGTGSSFIHVDFFLQREKCLKRQRRLWGGSSTKCFVLH